jgi:hypothetical protein
MLTERGTGNILRRKFKISPLDRNKLIVDKFFSFFLSFKHKMEAKLVEKSAKNDDIFWRSFVFVSVSLALLSVGLFQYFDIKGSILSERKRLNVTATCNESLLVFNRVPKVITYVFFR